MQKKIVALIYDESGNELPHQFKGNTRKDLFTAAQYHFGHCLGRVEHEDLVGWRFAYCEDTTLCARCTVVTVMPQEPVEIYSPKDKTCRRENKNGSYRR